MFDQALNMSVYMTFITFVLLLFCFVFFLYGVTRVLVQPGYKGREEALKKQQIECYVTIECSLIYR